MFDKDNVINILKNNFVVPRETIDKLEQFEEILLKWNSKINLIGKGTIDQIWYKHILDSAQLINYIDNFSSKLIDFGSGAGFPGVILSILGLKNVSLIESNNKKTAFLNKVSYLTANKLSVYNEKIEFMKPIQADIITSRALAKLNKLFLYVEKFTNKHTKILFLKGKNIDLEIEETNYLWEFNYKKHKSITSEEGVILEVTNLNKRK